MNKGKAIVYALLHENFMVKCLRYTALGSRGELPPLRKRNARRNILVMPALLKFCVAR